jgi:hypothetical protein
LEVGAIEDIEKLCPELDVEVLRYSPEGYS